MTLQKLLRGAVLGGLFIIPFIPLIVAYNLFFPFITGKNFAFRILVELVAGGWVGLALIAPEYRPRRSWMLAGFAAFVSIMFVADIFGTNPTKSIWSNFERMEGWVTLIHVFLYFVVLSAMLKTQFLWRSYWWTTIGVSLAVCLWGLAQFFGYIAIDQGGVRLDGPLGNATYLAAYLLIHLFIVALLWAQDWQVGKASKLRIAAYTLIIVLQSIILFFTATRGAIIGALGGAFLSALILVVLARKSKNAWRMATSVVVAILVIVGAFFALKDSALVKSSEPLRRLASISTTESTVTARFMNWGMAWKGIQERPVLGWGQEGYAVVFDKYYNPAMYAQEPWFDRVHNTVLDWFVAGGLLGILSYLSIYAAAFWAIWRSQSKQQGGEKGTFTIAEKSVLTGLLAGYFFHNLFVFDNITSYMLFAIVMAYVVSRSSADAAPVFSTKAVPQEAAPFAVGGAVLVAVALIFTVNVPGYNANRDLLLGLSAQDPAGPIKNLEYFKSAAGKSPIAIQESREHLAQVSTAVAGSAASAEVKQAFYDEAIAGMTQLTQMSPLDARFPLFLGIVHDAYGKHDLGEAALKKATELSPGKQMILFQYASNQLQRNDIPGMVATLKQAFDVAPNYRDARVYYAAALVIAGQDALAEETLQPVLTNVKSMTDQRLIGAYASRGQFAKIVRSQQLAVDANPSDVQTRVGLAAAQYQAGDKAGAIATLKKAIEINPPLKPQIDELIKQVQNGTVKVK
jgi:O-antigen ligase/Flp pilus assembly protein TadD